MGWIWALLVGAARELSLFAGVGIVICGLDDLLIDLIWIARTMWRRVTIYRHYPRATAATLKCESGAGPIAFFIPAWREAGVIGQMLKHALAAFGDAEVRFYVGTYRNDPETAAAVAAISDARIRIVECEADGPTTKADCLNCLWHALLVEERRDGRRVKAIAIHDAEDIVHSAEPGVYGALIGRFDLVQLPVLPLPDSRSRWVAGHYLDEFAEAHAKTMVVREAIGAALPLAGVGCAIERSALGRIADLRNGAPFDASSLTEDYELGLGAGAVGARTAFVRLSGTARGAAVSVRAHFPATIDEAVRQKARWIAGIALNGWDRLGWRGGVAERWMRLHDRRAPFAALILVAAYAALLLDAVILIGHLGFNLSVPPLSPVMTPLLVCGTALLGWRLVVRALFVWRAYGWHEGLRAIPRALVGNIIAIAASRRAMQTYLRMRREGVVRWDKTAHIFPEVLPAE